MKILLAVLAIFYSISAYANNDVTVTYELNEICDSGWCDAKECLVLEVDSDGSINEKIFYN